MQSRSEQEDWVVALRVFIKDTMGDSWQITQNKGKVMLGIRFKDKSRTYTYLPYKWQRSNQGKIRSFIEEVWNLHIKKKLGIKEGLKLKKPLLEYYYKEDSLDDPMITRDHLITFGWATNSELKKIDKMSLQINKHLRNLFFKKNIILVDFKIEFGRLSSNPKKIVLADEISPDSCRLWDKKTNKKLDKDVFRRNLGSLLSAYEEVASRLGIVH